MGQGEEDEPEGPPFAPGEVWGWSLDEILHSDDKNAEATGRSSTAQHVLAMVNTDC